MLDFLMMMANKFFKDSMGMLFLQFIWVAS